jgi:hypothetical protein
MVAGFRSRKSHRAGAGLPCRYCLSMISSENRSPLFRIMLYCARRKLEGLAFTGSSSDQSPCSSV